MLISKSISLSFSEVAFDSNSQATLFERLTLLKNVKSEVFITQPEELKLELLFYKRVNEQIQLDQEDLWLQNLKLKFGEDLANILWHNNHRFLSFESKQWVLESHEKIIHYAENKQAELKNYFPDLREHTLLKFLQCGLWIEYIDAFKLSKTNLFKLTRPYKKETLLLMLEIKKFKPDLSHYDCKELALQHPKNWKDVLLEIEIIKAKHPDLSDGYCKQLAIGYFKSWPKIIEIAAEIKNSCTELSDYICRKLAVSYKNTWSMVLKEQQKIENLHPEINPHDCKYLAINYFKTWQKVLSKVSEINLVYPTLTKERCTHLAIHHPKTWKNIAGKVKLLFENQFIKQYFSETLLFDLTINRRNGAKAVLDNFENIINQFRNQFLENKYQLRTLHTNERRQFYFAFVLLNTIKPSSQPSQADIHLSEKELFLWFKALLVIQLGRVGYVLLNQIGKTRWSEKNSVWDEPEYNEYDILIAYHSLSSKSIEQEMVEKENTEEFRQILNNILTKNEYDNLIKYSLEQTYDDKILKVAIQKIKNSPQSQLIREHLQNVVG